MKRLKLGKKLLILLQTPVVTGLAISTFAYLVPPYDAPWIAVLGLAYPVFLLLQLAFTLFWTLRLSRTALWSAGILVVFAFPHMSATFRFSGERETEDPGIRIMSYNIHNWRSYKDYTLHPSMDSIRSLIDKEHPDIVVIQEYGKVQKEHPVEYPHHAFYSNGLTNSMGYIILSVFPITNSGQVEFSEQRGTYRSFIWADIRMADTTVRMIDVHLVNTRLTPEDYQTLGGTSDHELNTEQIEEEGKDIYRRLASSFVIRGRQADELRAFMDESPYPVILCGDFNDTPHSYAYHELKRGMKDAFAQSGKGTGNSFNKLKMAPLRIDYILTDPMFDIRGYRTIRSEWSDHRPIMCTLYRSE